MLLAAGRGERMGALTQSQPKPLLDVGGERARPVGRVPVSPGARRGIEVAAEEVVGLIDEVPLLAVLAARASGTTRITGAAELRAKESDRIATTVSNLRAIGVEAEELPDGLVVQGTPSALRGPVACHHDHRIAMSFAVLGATASAEIAVDDPGVADVSFPGFAALVGRLARGAA